MIMFCIEGWTVEVRPSYYTTETTYVLDIGIISPLCFLSLWLAHRKNPFSAAAVSFVPSLLDNNPVRWVF